MKFEDLVSEERARQDKKWGEQNHFPPRWLGILIEEVGELSKEINECNIEVEDMNAPDWYPRSGKLEHELIQCVAVLKVMWESGKRNGWL